MVKRGSMNFSLYNLNNLKIVKIISAIVVVVALLVITGWIFNIEFLRTVIPNVTAMRLLTAICFLGCSLSLFSLAKLKEKNFDSTTYIIYLIIGSFFVLLLMVISVFNILGVNFNLEGMINPNYVDNAKTFPVSVPSISTMFLFVLISLTGFVNIFCSVCSRIITKIIGFINSIVAVSVILGYLFGIPSMYFAISGISNAMAIHTAVLFLIIGIALVLLNKENISNKNFTTRYTIQQKLLIGFSVLIGLVVIMASVTSIIIRENNINLKQIKEVEAPLQVMVQEVIGYDAMLTENVHWAILDSINNESDEVIERKAHYDEIGTKLDNLLKFDARNLLEKSQRGTDDKKIVYGYLAELDRINLALVDLERGAFKAVDKGDVKTALSLTCEGKYYEYKDELAVYYKKWADEEAKINNLYKTKNLNNLRYILIANLILGLLIIIVAIVMARFITKTIVKPLDKLDDVAEEISSGNIDMKISSESKKMPGIIGNIANSFDKLLESSHFALKNLVESKMNKKYELLYTSSKDAIMTLEPPVWNFTSGNLSAVKMFNTKNEKEFISLRPFELSPKYQPDGQLSIIKAKKMIEKAMKDGTNFFEWTHKRYNGKEFPATVLLSRVKEGRKTYLQATVRDLTKTKDK
jgi:HAMP domain-containing protein